MVFKHTIRFIVLLGLIIINYACSSPPLTTTVEVTGGTIEGVEQDGILTYKGIPFAAPPVGRISPVRVYIRIKKRHFFPFAHYIFYAQ